MQGLPKPADVLKGGRTSPTQRAETSPRTAEPRGAGDVTSAPAVIADTASAENMGRVDPASVAPAPAGPVPVWPPVAVPPTSEPVEARPTDTRQLITELAASTERLAEIANAFDDQPGTTERADRQRTELERSAERLEELARSLENRPARPVTAVPAAQLATTGAPKAAGPTVVASSDDPDSKLADEVLSRRDRQAGRPTPSPAKPAPALKPADTQPANAQPAEAQPGNAQPANAQPANAQRAEGGEEAKVGEAGAKQRVDETGLAEPMATDPALFADGDHVSDSQALADRLSGYQIEAAELLAGAAARRKRRTTTASGLPAPDPATQEPQIKLTRPPRPGPAKPPPKG